MDGVTRPAAESDEALAVEAQQGNCFALENLARRHCRAVFGTCLRILGNEADAEDACQETFARLAREIAKYDGARAFLPWLTTMASNLSLNLARGRGRRSVHEGGFGRQFGGPGTGGIRVDSDEVAGMEAAIRELPDRYRRALALKYREGKSNPEIGAALEIPVNSVRVVLFRALDLVRKRVGTAGRRS